MSGECQFCGEHTLECECCIFKRVERLEEELDKLTDVVKIMSDFLTSDACLLMHSRVPKMTDRGVILVCNEGV